INGRWVRDRSLGHALQEAYRGLLMTGRYAVAFLFVDLPPHQVDVNVHPTKVEVRFQDSQAMHQLVFAGVRERLRKQNLTARLQVPMQAPSWSPPLAPPASMPWPPEPASVPPWQAPPQPEPEPEPGAPLFSAPAPAASAPVAPASAPLNLPPPGS